MNKRLEEKTKQIVWFTSGALCGLAMLSICKASIGPGSSAPGAGLNPAAVTNDTAIYQNLSEIQIRKERTPNFDADISHLSQMESRYREKPSLSQNVRVVHRKTKNQTSYQN